MPTPENPAKAQNEHYIIEAHAFAPTTIEKTRLAARIYTWGDRHGIVWKAPFRTLANNYLNTIKRRRSLNGFLTAANRTYDLQKINDITKAFIDVFEVQGRKPSAAPGHESTPEIIWQIPQNRLKAQPWPEANRLPQIRTDLDFIERYLRVINAALDASELSITAELAAVIYLTMSRNDIEQDPFSKIGINILEYDGASYGELKQLGRKLNRVGLDIRTGVSYCEKRC
ncbi:hypothetical protein ABW21_db0200955 [Orbilia brochopaga]|nr:hypothetical protein ABW21_db0200955 [Drechslerella brochopaga]